MANFSFWATQILVWLFLFQSCGLGPDRVTGTSSGVDNPQLTVAFTDTNGNAILVTGTVSLFGENQNPAVVGTPLATIRLDNSGYVNLSSLDLDRSGSGKTPYSTSSLVKQGAAEQQLAIESDSLVKFNIYLKTEGKQGAIAMGLAYDGLHRRFVVTGDTTTKRVDLKTKPLRKVQGILVRSDSTIGPDRLFIPGTPFVSVLVDSVFEFDDIPDGLFDLRLLTSDGNMVKVKQPFDSRAPMRYTVDEVTSQPLPDTIQPVDFEVAIRADSSALMQFGAFLEGYFMSHQPGDWQVTWLWRLVEGPTQTISIQSPTQSKTPVSFYQPGLYTFELSGTVGTVTHRDSVRIAVEGITLPGNRFLAPGPGQIISIGRNFRVVWQSESIGIYQLNFFLDSGSLPIVLDTAITSKIGLNEFEWNVDSNFPEVNRAALMLKHVETDSIIFGGPFQLRRGPGPGQH